MNPLIMHINYCEQGQTIPEICRKAAAFGFDGVEFRQSGKAGAEAYLRETSDSARACGLTALVYACHADGVCSPDASVRREAVKGVIGYITAANEIAGAKLFNSFTEQFVNKEIPCGPDYLPHGSAAASPEDWQRAAECFSEIGEAAEKLGVRLAFETHMLFLHDTPASAAKLVRLIGSPSIGINMDFGNTVYFSRHPSLEECVSLYGNKLYDVHLKNSVPLPDGSHIPTSLGGGEINHRQYLRLLKAAGYRGPVTLEAPRPGDRELFAVQDIAYYKRLRDEVGFF